jgi:RNA polymerase sigma-32 factor
LARDREIVERRVFQASTLDDLSLETGVTKERVRQITKRAAKTIAEIASADPRFAVMAEYGRAAPTKRRQPVTASLLPDADQPHNRLASVRAIQPVELGIALAAPAENVERVEAVLLAHVEVPSNALLH